MGNVAGHRLSQIGWKMACANPRRRLVAGGEIVHHRLGVEFEFDIVAVVVEKIDRRPALRLRSSNAVLVRTSFS